ncbi:MAG: glycoside hydrolase family 13 protein [Anaerovoracaceae bacterium]
MGSNEFQCPQWLKKGVMYQIFPDRFQRSPHYLPPVMEKNYILREDWGGEPKYKDEDGVVRNNDFFGGNLRGIMEKLSYLENLGVTVIYLNPIFEAYSNHRYDTADFKRIDPLLGTEEDFVELCKKAAEKGIKIILDGVFNHTGSDSIYFNKYGRYPNLGAYQSRDSIYYEWFRFIKYPEEYESWWGIDTLPSVEETCESYLNYIIRDSDSVVRRWLRLGASGYRLDVVDELPDIFLHELRKVVKEEKSDAAIIGEVWEDATTKVCYGQQRHYLDGTQLDSVMNYPLKDSIIQFVTGLKDAPGLGEDIERLWNNYPKTVFDGLMNILGTHDTPRIRSVLSKGVSQQIGRQRLYLAMLPWALMPGIPCVYYGDENGMEGGRDPENRRCFQPSLRDNEIFTHYKRLLNFRGRIEEIQNMDFEPAMAKGSFYAFKRVNREDGSLLLVAMNGGENSEVLRLKDFHRGRIKDFFISGNVSFSDISTFEIGPVSGVAVYLR